MKSQHRHELKTNELADWIGHFPEWLKQNRRMIIYACILLVAVVGYSFWFRHRKASAAAREQIAFTQLLMQIPQTKAAVADAASKGNDQSFVLLDTAEKLRNMAAGTKDNRLAALALIKRAELLRAELLYRIKPPGQDETAKQVGEAKDAYTRAAELGSLDPALLAKARFGVGLCEEEIGNFDQAGDIYKQVAEDPAFKGTVTVAQAQMRLDTMADYRTKVVFAPAPVTATAQPEGQAGQAGESSAPVGRLFPETAGEQPAAAMPDTNAIAN